MFVQADPDRLAFSQQTSLRCVTRCNGNFAIEHRNAGEAIIPQINSQGSAAIDLVFDYTYDTNGFFNSEARKNTLEAAGTYFESQISDNLGAITSSGGNSFNIEFTNPANGNSEFISDFSVAENQLTVFVGGRRLGGSTLGEAGFGGYGASASSK